WRPSVASWPPSRTSSRTGTKPAPRTFRGATPSGLRSEKRRRSAERRGKAASPGAPESSQFNTVGGGSYAPARGQPYPSRAPAHPDVRRGPAADAARPGPDRSRQPPWRGERHATPPRRRATGHHQRAGPLARAGRLCPARPGGPGPGRARLLAPAGAWSLRVLVSRRLRAADRGVALLRLPAPRPAGQGPALAPEHPRGLRRGAGPDPVRGPAHGHRAGRGQEGRSVVGLVRHQDRGGVAAGHRRGDLRPPDRLAADL